jgi:hypothetical protein
MTRSGRMVIMAAMMMVAVMHTSRMEDARSQTEDSQQVEPNIARTAT